LFLSMSSQLTSQLTYTTIAITHRLGTVQNVSVIYAINKGRAVESGYYKSLMERRGRYWELVCLQSLKVAEYGGYLGYLCVGGYRELAF
jgi:ABC-type multidrug transport system fused ATPase/permease subunit